MNGPFILRRLIPNCVGIIEAAGLQEAGLEFACRRFLASGAMAKRASGNKSIVGRFRIRPLGLR